MSRFPTAAHLAAWAGLAPATNESARKQSPAGKRHGNKWLTAMLVEAAGSWVGCRARYICPPNVPGCQTARDGPSPGRHRPLDSRVGALDVDPRRAIPRPRSRLAPAPQQRGPRPATHRPARTPGPHGDHRPSRLDIATSPSAPGTPTRLQPALHQGIHGSVWWRSGAARVLRVGRCTGGCGRRGGRRLVVTGPIFLYGWAAFKRH